MTNNAYTKRRAEQEELARILKKQAIDELESGNRHVVLDVKGVDRRARHIVRSRVNRWLRNNQWRGRTHFDGERWTITIDVLQRIESARIDTIGPHVDTRMDRSSRRNLPSTG